MTETNMMKDIRIRFEKLGRVKYISHLDLTRTMTRVVRRAGIPVWYTEGFNHHPYLTFSAPLSLGFEGLKESMDLRLVEDMPMEEVVARFNAVLPEGLTVYNAGEPAMKADEIAFARYRLTFSGNTSCLADFLRQESITAEKKSKKGVVRQMDLKPYLEGAETVPADGRISMELTLPCSSTETVNPLLIANALQEYTAERNAAGGVVFCDVLRLDILNSEMQPFA